jgi:type IV pilus assembly protein PilM
VFGLDIGSHTVKLVQLSGHAKHANVVGYGHAAFSPDAITEGIISDPEPIAAAIKEAVAKPSGGKISARRTILSVPVAKMFTRTLQLPPKMKQVELDQAVHFEAEQYVPVPSNDLYVDYEVISDITKQTDHTEVLMVAAPRAIIDSYIKLFDYLDVDVAAIETGLTAITRAMVAGQDNQTSLIVDFGTGSADMAIYEQSIRVTGSFAVGGGALTQTLVKQLGITTEQANEIKYRFGIKASGLQPKIVEALKPQLATVTTEMKKVLKYYQERSENKTKIGAMILTGGTSAMPGLDEYLSKELGIPAVIPDPWKKLQTKHVGDIPASEAPMYTTAIGLAQRGLMS